MDWRERIIVDPKILVGKPVIKGTRIAVEFVIDLLARGWTTEQILREYDHLTVEDIHACLAYPAELASGRGGISSGKFRQAAAPKSS
jgi:uncharacterized protein (DUF433 family)